MALDVLYADNHLLVVAKPAGLPVVPDESRDESLLDRARAWIEREFDKPGRAYLGVVHRLDRPVSGVVAFARTSKAAARLTAAFREGRVRKTYWGVAPRAPSAGAGRGEEERGELEQWLQKDRRRNTVRDVGGPGPGAKRALTRWRVLRRTGAPGRGRVLVELEPVTGRSHQLRIAMATLGAPLLGDLRYGAREPLEDASVALHARRLELPHPTRPESMVFEAPPPSLAVWRFD